MERAARVFRKAKQPRALLNDEEVLRAVWPAAVGKAIAAHTFHVKLVRTNVVVEMEDALWQRQLRPLEKQILERLQLLTPDVPISGIEFRVGVPRRRPQRSTTSGALIGENEVISDEADGIQDPVLKKVYQISRRKASA